MHDATAAEDVAQEAFLAAVRALDRFDRRRPFGPWLLLSPSAANAPITAIGSISRRFGAPPTVQGWCCG